MSQTRYFSFFCKYQGNRYAKLEIKSSLHEYLNTFSVETEHDFTTHHLNKDYRIMYDKFFDQMGTHMGAFDLMSIEVYLSIDGKCVKMLVEQINSLNNQADTIINKISNMFLGFIYASKTNPNKNYQLL